MTASYIIRDSVIQGKVEVVFLVGGRINYDERGTDGTGLKLYDDYKKACSAVNRYIKKMKANGFEIN